METKDKWCDGKYFGIPILIKLLPKDGIEIKGKNKFWDMLIVPVTFVENIFNGIGSFFFDDYIPHFRFYIKEEDKE